MDRLGVVQRTDRQIFVEPQERSEDIRMNQENNGKCSELMCPDEVKESMIVEVCVKNKEEGAINNEEKKGNTNSLVLERKCLITPAEEDANHRYTVLFETEGGSIPLEDTKSEKMIYNPETVTIHEEGERVIENFNEVRFSTVTEPGGANIPEGRERGMENEKTRFSEITKTDCANKFEKRKEVVENNGKVEYSAVSVTEVGNTPEELERDSENCVHVSCSMVNEINGAKLLERMNRSMENETDDVIITQEVSTNSQEVLKIIEEVISFPGENEMVKRASTLKYENNNSHENVKDANLDGAMKCSAGSEPDYDDNSKTTKRHSQSTEETAMIQQLPEMVLEDILRHLSLEEICKNVRPTCRAFYHATARVLRIVFRNILPRLEMAMERLEQTPFCKQWSRICTSYLTYKLLQSEFKTLRAACARQVESGLWCFVPGKTLEEYIRLITAIQSNKISGILEKISTTLVSINKLSLDYFDIQYEQPFNLRDMKLFGVELLEILNAAMNVSSSMAVTYRKEGGSCFVMGKISIPHCTELHSPPLKSSQRKTILMYLRYLVRANNCDIVLRNLREWNKIVNPEINLPGPFLGSPEWKLKDRFNVSGGYIHEVYNKDAVVESPSSDWSECNMAVECNFKFICPKYIKPLGIQFENMKEDDTGSEPEGHDNTCEVANELLQMLVTIWEKNENFRHLEGEEYKFNMSLQLKLVHPNGMSMEENIQVSEMCITDRSGKQECVFHIEACK